MRPYISDLELVKDILTNIVTAIKRIERRFQSIENADDFLGDDERIDRLDGITMIVSIHPLHPLSNPLPTIRSIRFLIRCQLRSIRFPPSAQSAF